MPMLSILRLILVIQLVTCSSRILTIGKDRGATLPIRLVLLLAKWQGKWKLHASFTRWGMKISCAMYRESLYMYVVVS